MRLSTSMMYELGLRSLQSNQTGQMDLQQKLSSGKRVDKPSDDPIAAAGIITLGQAKSINSQYGTNAQSAQAQLGLEVDALSDVNSLLQDIKTMIVKAGNPALQNQDRMSIAAEVKVQYQQLMAISNRADGNGEYLFSGYQGTTQPFAETAPGVVAFSGDEGQRLVQIGPTRRIAVNDSGAEVFQRVREGNGTFITKPALTNTGSGVSSAGTVRNIAAWQNPANSGDYTVKFDTNNATTPPTTTYDIVNTATNVSMLTGVASGAGPYARTFNTASTIDFQRQPGDPSAAAWDAGVQLQITGAPATGDTFQVKSSGTKDIFSTVNDLINRLSSPLPVGVAPRAQYDSDLANISSGLDAAMDHVLTVVASTGVRMKELDSTQTTTQNLGLRYDEDISRLQDLDYAKALSDLSQKQFSLEAAQKSYVAVTSLKLFDFIK